MPELQGKRYPDNTSAMEMEPGGYAYHDWTRPPHWQIRDPLGDIGSIRTHKVIIGDDGSITVEPSIAPDPSRPGAGFHGWLKAGVWSW